ncbi:MAG: hypothetical protein ACLQLC_09645 [Candidatus Sulfotelmatobacter sp.]
MPANVLEKPVTDSATSPVTTEAVGKRVESAQQPISKTSDSQPVNRHQKMRKNLRAVFEGHNEFLGWTPD